MSTLCSLYLIACHAGPALHFATFAAHLEARGYAVCLYASGPALQKCQEMGVAVHPFGIDGVLDAHAAAALAKKCAQAATVITDVGHPFATLLQQELKEKAPLAIRAAYYDNPESYVPGGYSDVASKVMCLAQWILFANTNLARSPLYQAPNQEIPLDAARKIGVGFYPLKEVEKLIQRRESERGAVRARLLADHPDKGQRLLVYLGGNNETYFSLAFPACLRLFTEAMQETDLSHYTVILQQHPGAKAHQRDAALCQAWIREQGQHPHAPQWIISGLRSDEALVAADAVLYYQTSMGPQCALAHIPTIQLGHEVYSDVLVTAGLCAVATQSRDLSHALTHLKTPSASDEDLKHRLGMRSDWIEQLLSLEREAHPPQLE